MGLSMIGVVLFASVALADKPVQDPNCTFEQGETTCTQTVQTDSYIEARLQGTHPIKGCPGGINYVYQNFRIDTYETTTIIYRGMSDRVKSESTESFQTETAVGSPLSSHSSQRDNVLRTPTNDDLYIRTAAWLCT
jgi:hypothetical protein